MFQTRLLREDDALLIFETLAFLLRKRGTVQRPAVPSPLHKTRGIDRLYWEEMDQRTVFDFAEDCYATVLSAMDIRAQGLRLAASATPLPGEIGFILYDPKRCDEPGYLVSQLTTALADREIEEFDPGTVLTRHQNAVMRLAATAFFGQGFALANILPAVAEALDRSGATPALPPRLLENALTFAQVLVLRALNQSPEQIIATYGPVMTKTARKKMRLTCRQIDGFEPELKLLRVLCEGQQVSAIAGRQRAASYPQRISWI